ncbi:MAG TPA: membrane protein insertase YidC [Bacteroidales bacterium]|nr:membrane protein insertase YidC [Bacteroidales bacterium]
MDRNTIIGILLIGIILVLYSIYTQPTEEEIAAMKRQRDSIAQIEQAQNAEIAKQAAITQATTKQDIIIDNSDSLSTKNDSIKQIQIKQQYGEFASATEGELKFYTIENSLLKLVFTNKGGKMFSAEIKNYLTYDKQPLILFSGDSTIFGLNFFDKNRSINTDNLFFTTSGNSEKKYAKDQAVSISFRLNSSNNRYIEYIYTLAPNSYKVDFTIKFSGMDDVLSQNMNMLALDWSYYVRELEKSKISEDNYTTIYYKPYGDDIDKLSSSSDDKEELTTKVRWVAFKQQFFTNVLIANQYFSNVVVEQNKLEEKGYIKKFHANMILPTDNIMDTKTFPMSFYIGPNQYNTLRKYSKISDNDYLDLQKLVNLGWGIFGWVNRFIVIPIFNFFNQFINNYGIIILLLTIAIKIIILPFTYKSYISSAKMKVLKPEIDEIQKKIPKEKAMERQQAIMSLYKKAGVNPLGGCLPMLFQMPILYAMFRFFPTSIELRQQGFLWADDLSSYDSVLDLPFSIPMYGDHVSLFALLMTISMIFYTRMQNQMNPAQSGTMPGMKTMMYIMPIFFMAFLNNYSSGLSYYYFLANIITFLQMYLFRRFVDENKLRAQIEYNKKKPVKKSNFQKRMEEIAKQRGRR